MNYRDLIKEAFWITLRKRFLRFFRFFISGGIGSSNFNPSTGGPGNFNGGLGYASPTWLSEPTRRISMMLRRSEDLSVVEGEHARRLWRNLARRGWKLNEPLDDQLPIRKAALAAQGFRAADKGESSNPRPDSRSPALRDERHKNWRACLPTSSKRGLPRST